VVAGKIHNSLIENFVISKGVNPFEGDNNKDKDKDKRRKR
jgi:hypothetical protein